jgi:hypothetical protein
LCSGRAGLAAEFVGDQTRPTLRIHTEREKKETPIGEGKETEWSWKEYLERSLAGGAAEAIRMKFCVCDGQHLPGHDALPTPVTHCCTLQRFLRGRMFTIKEREEV